MDEENPFRGIFSPTQYDLQTPGSQLQPPNAHGIQTPLVPIFSPESTATTPNESPAPSSGRLRSRKQHQAHRPQLALLRREEWDKDKAYDEDPPCLHYSIEWRVIVNKKMVSKDTEPDVVLNPAAYWQDSLKFRVERLLYQKLGENHSAEIEDINVAVSVTTRSERDLIKRFELEIDWRVVEKQLVQWGAFFQNGKKLRVDITFNYVEVSRKPAAGSSKRGGKRGSSATQRMLTDLATECNAEKESSGQTPAWTEVYRLMRCPGPPCPLGPHCWRDPNGKKHYRLYPHHLRSLVKYVQDGSKLQCQDDVPDDIRQQLYAEERQRLERKQKKAAASPLGLTPITINNNFPEHPQPASLSMSRDGSNDSIKTCSTLLTGIPLDIPGPLDTNVREYSEWQKSLVHEPMAKAQVDKACDVDFDLNQLHGDQDFDFLVQEAVNEGTARRFVGGIPDWVKRRKCE